MSNGNIEGTGLSNTNSASQDIHQDSKRKAQKAISELKRKSIKDEADKLFNEINAELVFKFHEKSGKWYGVIENKVTHDVIKEIPSKFMRELDAQIKEMIGFFLDKKF